MLDSYSDPFREVTLAAEDALDHFAREMPPQKSLAVLSPFILSAPGPLLQMSIRLLSKLVYRVSYEELLHYIPNVIAGLFDAFKNPSADVRKAVVFCLVDIYMVLGENFTPYLSQLSTSQLKLVTIYINRMTKAREELSGRDKEKGPVAGPDMAGLP